MARQPARRPHQVAEGLAEPGERPHRLRRRRGQRPVIRSLFTVLLAALLLAPAAPASAGEAEWKMLQEQAEQHFRRGNLPQAEQFGREALREAEATFGPE